MKEYILEIKETLKRRVVVWADNESEAIDMVQEQYDNEDIVLDSGDFVQCDIDIIKEEEN